MKQLPAEPVRPTSVAPSPLPVTDRRTLLKSTVSALGVLTAGKCVSAENVTQPPTQIAPGEPFDVARDPLMISRHTGMIRARDQALDILKPTQAQLEHGLELHRHSLVFDTYGFAPRGAVDGAALAQAEADGASDDALVDLRSEMTMTRPATDPREREEFLNAMQTAGVTCIFQNAGEEGNDPLLLIKRLAHFTYLGDRFGEGLTRAAWPADIEAARTSGQHCLFLTGNGIPLPPQHSSAVEDLGLIRLFFQLGIRMMHLTYNRRNLFGDGCAEPANAGISDFGRMAIAEMNRVGVIVDVAHSGWRTSLEAALASTKPIVASHTTCAGVHEHIRSKPDEVIRAICDSGGLIGICCIPPFLGGSGDIASLIGQIDYAVKKFGVDHVAIGTDVAHVSQYSERENAKTKSRGRRSPRFASLWPPDALGGNWPRAQSLAWTNWPLFTVGLVQNGYSDEEIQKILGRNMMRVCHAALE